MKHEMSKLMSVINGLIFVAGLVVIAGYPRHLPHDGTERHTWHLVGYTSSNTVWISDGVVQDYFSETAMAHRNFGDKIHYHWFKKPTLDPVIDENGICWKGEMIK
jgi:hypothetical protein